MADSNQNLKLNGPGLQMFMAGTELYDIDSTSSGKDSQSPESIRYYGGNALRFMMLFNHPGQLKSAPFWEMVKRIMENPKAFNRKEEDFTVVNLYENPGCTFDDIVQELNPAFCLIWGPEACSGFEFSPYEIIQRDGMKLLMADDPVAVQGSREMKDKLWAQLQHQL